MISFYLYIHETDSQESMQFITIILTEHMTKYIFRPSKNISPQLKMGRDRVIVM